MLSRVSVGGRSRETSRAPDRLPPEPEIPKKSRGSRGSFLVFQIDPRFLTTRVSGNDGNATGCPGLSGRLDFIENGRLGAGSGLDLIQARDNAAAEDVGSFRPYFNNDVAEFADVGHGLLVGGLRQVD